MAKAKSKFQPTCLECTDPKIVMTTGERIYPHRRDLWHQDYHICKCGAYVRCHEGTDTALGHCAGPVIRELRQKVHGVFDPLWELKLRIKPVYDNLRRKGFL